MKRTLYILILLFLSLSSFSQKQANRWYFGNMAAIDFNTGVPVPFAGSAMYILEGCSSIADTNGNTLFYTNGLQVWDKSNTQMPNGFGLLGDDNAAQSALIVQQPGSDSLYYIFTSPTNGTSPMHYSIVDMSLNGGLGDVAVKNVFMFNNSTEKVTACLAANGTDVWVVAHEWQTNNFYSFPLTATGVGVPVITSVGSVHTGTLGFAGYMKTSHCGHKLAYAITISMDIVEVLDFDNTTGIPSNPITFNNISEAYGLEFSPDDTKLYATEENPQLIIQWDLNAGSSAAIIASQTTVGTGSGSGFAALQLGPDGKIYLAKRMNQPALGAINNPNVAGLGCNFVDNVVTLVGGNSMYGLPNMMQSLFCGAQVVTQNFTSQNFCLGDSTWFILNNQGVDSVHWDFGDVGSGLNNTSTQIHPFHIFTLANTFNVQLISFSGGISDTITHQIIIQIPPQVNLGNDTSMCQLPTIVLDAGNSGATYLWQDNSTNQTLSVTTSGTYWVNVSINSCTASDSIVISIGTGPVINLGNDTSVCLPDTLTFDATFAGASYLWANGSTTSTIRASVTGEYYVTVSLAGCNSVDSIHLTENPKPPASVSANQTVFCSGDSAQICGNASMTSYLWNTGETTMCISTQLAGNYYVTLTDVNGCSAVSNHLAITVYSSPPVSISVNGDTLSSYNAVTYQWFLNGNPITGATSQTYIATQGGSYTVEVTDTNGCSAFSTAVIISAIQDLSNDCELSIYPNPIGVGPAGGRVQLMVGKDLVGSKVEIIDAEGRLVLVLNIEHRMSNIELNAAAGIYLMRVISEKNIITTKLIKL